MTQHVTVTLDSNNGTVRCQFGALQATYLFGNLVTLHELQQEQTIAAKRNLLETRAKEKFAAAVTHAAEAFAQPA